MKTSRSAQTIGLFTVDGNTLSARIAVDDGGTLDTFSIAK